MHLWSKGLGKLILPLDMGAAELHLTPQQIILAGEIREGKIIWDYTIKMSDDDLVNFTNVLVNREVLEFLAREHGLRLPIFIAQAAVGFLLGLFKSILGKGSPIVEEATLGLGPKPKKSRKRVRPRREAS